jgi:hypothetical protein
MTTTTHINIDLKQRAVHTWLAYYAIEKKYEDTWLIFSQ